MKTRIRNNHSCTIRNISLAACLSLLSAWTAHAQNLDLYASINHPNPTGPGAVYKYTPAGVQTTVLASVVNPRGLAFDCAGDLFVASTNFDNIGNAVGSILEITPGGAVSTFATGFPTNFFLSDIKLDSSGNLFVMAINISDPNSASTIFEVSPGGGVSIFGTIPAQGLGLAFDSAGNLFAADAGDQTIFKFTPTGIRSVFVGPSAFLPTQGPVGLAFNSTGNLFASTEDNIGNGEILEFAPNGAETTFATGLTNNPRGLAFDSAGDLFVAEVSPPGAGPGDILKYPAGTNVPTVFAVAGRPQGNGGPEFLAFPLVCCHRGDGDGDAEEHSSGKNEHHHFHKRSSCNDPNDNENDNVQSDDNHGSHFQSTSFTSSTYNIHDDSQAITIVGTGLHNGLPVTFTMIAINYGNVAPGVFNITLTDGYSFIGSIVNGTIHIQ